MCHQKKAWEMAVLKMVDAKWIGANEKPLLKHCNCPKNSLTPTQRFQQALKNKLTGESE